MTRLLERRHNRRKNRRRSSRLRFDLSQAVRSPPGDVAGFAPVDKPRDSSLRVAYEDASRSRLAGLEEYVQNLCAEMARRPRGAFKDHLVVLAAHRSFDVRREFVRARI